MWGPLWPQNGCWLGLQWRPPPSPAVTIAAVYGIILCHGAARAIISVATGTSLNPEAELSRGLVWELSRGSFSAQAIATTFYVMSPTATNVYVILFGYALTVGFSLSLSFVDPFGNDAIVQVVARRLFLASSVAAHQLLLFKAVSAPLMLFFLLGLAIYLARVWMAGTAESEEAKHFVLSPDLVGGLSVLAGMFYGLGTLILLVAPLIYLHYSTWVGSRSAQVLPTTHQGTAPAPPTTHQGTMSHRLAPRSNAPVHPVPQPPLMHPVAPTAIGVTDHQVSLAPGSGPAGSGMGDGIPTAEEPRRPEVCHA